MTAYALPLALLVAGLGLYQFHAQQESQLATLGSDISEAKIVVDGVVKDVQDHVAQMAAQAGDLLDGKVPVSDPGLRAFLKPSFPPGSTTTADGMTLDEIAGTPLESRIGNMYLAENRLAAALPGELDATLALFEPMRLSHLVAPYLRWSYYFSASKAFVAIAPFVKRQDMVEGFGHASIGEMVDSYLTYDVYLDATPARNPNRKPYWSPPYLDAAGTGWMVSHAVPFYSGDRFAGMLGTDLLLSFMDATLKQLPLAAGEMWIVSSKGELIADRSGTPASGDAPRKLASVLPSEFGALGPALPAILAAGRHDLAGHRIFAAEISGTPWTLLHVVSNGELNGIIARRLTPYAIILLALMLSIFAAHRALRREFVRPAIALVDYLRTESTGNPRPAPKTSALWQPWIDLASNVFAENRAVMQKAAESEERYRNVVEAQTEYIVRIAPNGRMSFANDAYCRLVGKTREELLSPDWHYFNSFSPDFGSFEEIISRVSPKRPVCEAEGPGKLLDGRMVHIHWTDRGIFDDDGKLLEIQAVGRDITEQKLARQALEDSEQRYRSVVELQTEFVVRMSPDGYLRLVNDAYCRYHGKSREELLDPSWCEYSVLLPEELRRFKEHLARLTPAAPDASIELCNELAGGQLSWLAWNDHGIFDDEGRLIEVQSVGRDISDRVRAEDARLEAEKLLAEREAQFRAIAEGVPIPVIISAIEEPEILFVNEPARKTLGLEVGQSGDVATSVWEHRPWRDDLVRLLVNDGIVDAFEAGMIKADGARIDTLISARRITQGGRAAMLAAVTDITRQREAEAEIARQRETLYQSEKLSALGSLLAGVAHELNNPLSVVIGYSSMLKEFSTDEATAGRADKIHAAAERCSRIVRTFLAMARKKPPTRGAVDVNEIVSASLELAAYGLRSGGVETRTELAEDLPPIWGDADQLHQVITNLVVNAQQALVQVPHPRRLAIVTVADGDGVEIVVADNGPGMPESVRSRAFEPFYTTKPSGIGTGVGLSVCQGIVTAHEGSITLDSREGGGARFTVRLPCGNAEAVSPQDPAVKATGRSSAARVLVVDDDADIAAMIAEMLRGDGHKVTIAEDADAALEAVRQGGIDLLISDIRMPGLDGPGLYRALERVRPGLTGRLLFVTGDTLAPEIDRFINDTGASVIEKPLDPQTFRRLVLERLSAMQEAEA